MCGSPGRAWLTLLASLVSAYPISYLICVGSMWGGLFGSPMLAPLPALLGTLEITLAVLIARKWEPGYGPTLLSWLWVALAAKLLLAEFLVYYDITLAPRPDEAGRRRPDLGRVYGGTGGDRGGAARRADGGAGRRRAVAARVRAWRPRRCCTGAGTGRGRERRAATSTAGT